MTPRIPLIKFIGKRSNLAHSVPSSRPTNLSITEPNISKAAIKPQPQRQSIKQVVHSPNAVDFTSLTNKAMYGRPRFFEDEMDAIETGGATALDPPGIKKKSKAK